MIRNRVRFRFRKEDELRLISHRDLVRAFERLFRRAGLCLSMSEGFHPRPRMTFPSALSLGIIGRDEVMEVELAEPYTPEELFARLAPHLPPGLSIDRIECLPPPARKARIRGVEFEVPVPRPLQDQVRQRVDSLRALQTCWVDRRGGRRRVEVRGDLESIEISGGQLRLRLRFSPQGGAQCRDVLEALGLGDLEQQGVCICRSRVELEA